MNLSMKQKQTHRHREQTWVCQKVAMEERWIGSLGLADANYHNTGCINNMVYCIAQGHSISCNKPQWKRIFYTHTHTHTQASQVKNPPAMQETYVRFLGGEDPLEEDMATHSSILSREIPWTEEPGRAIGPWGCKT